MIFQFKSSEPRWINFENPMGEKGRGGIENNGAKGHAFEDVYAGEEKILCNFDGCGIIRRIWITLSNRSPEILNNVYIKMFWDGSDTPQVYVPLGDFFCMGLGVMRSFENRFFSTAEGRSFLCTIPMPFRHNAKIVLINASQKKVRLFYDIDLTIEDLPDDTMYFNAYFSELCPNELEKDVEILTCNGVGGRFIGANIAVIPNDEQYHGLWWGEGEVKIYIDGDRQYATLVGTGTEDYVGSAWELGEFINQDQGCVSKIDNAVSMYRFHINDPIYFKDNIRVTLQAMGGGSSDTVKTFAKENVPYSLVTFEKDCFRRVYKQNISVEETEGYVNFFRQDHYRTVAYYYVK